MHVCVCALLQYQCPGLVNVGLILVAALCVCVCVHVFTCVYVSVCRCLCLSVCMRMCVATINGSVLCQAISFVCSAMQLVQLNILCIHIQFSCCQTILFQVWLIADTICTETVLRGVGSGIASPYIDYSPSLYLC